MEILQVGSYPPPHGGQSVHIKNLKDFLISKGHDCRVLNTGENKGIRDERVTNIANGLALIRGLWTARADLIHVHCGRIGTFLKVHLSYFISKICRRQALVVTVHSGLFVNELDQLPFLKRWLLMVVLGRLDCIICVNEQIRDRLGRGGVSRERLAVIPAYSLHEDLTNVTLPDEVETFLSRHAPVLSCMGFFQPQYGFDLAAEAVGELRAKHPTAGLVIMASGEPDESMVRSLQDRSGGGILILHDMEKSACLKVVSRSSIFLRPTDYDGDALSVREALAVGTPVLASRVGNRPRGTVLFNRRDREDLLRKLQELLTGESPSARRRLIVEDDENLVRISGCYREASNKK